MSITTTGNLGPVILQSLAPAMLYTPSPGLNYILPADKVSMPMQGGTTMRFLRPRLLTPPTVQLGNSGLEPTSQVPQRDIVDAQMAFFGTSCIINEQVILQDQDPVLAWVSDRLAYAMRQAEDIILRDYLMSAASVINCDGGSNGDNPTELSVSDFSLVGQTLDTNNAWKFEHGVEGSLKFGTSPVRSAYICLSSTQVQSDLDRLIGSGFKNVWDYPAMASTAPLEYGSCLNFRIFTSSQAASVASASMNGRTVFYNTCVGKQAYTHIDQDGYSMKLIYRDPYFSGPLAQNATLAVKFAQSQAITQDTAIRLLASTNAA